MKPTYEELEQKLAESQREFRAADATIENLQMKLEKLSSENAGLKKFCKDAAFDADYEAELGMERGGFTDALNNIKTPATDAFLAEVRDQGVEMFAKEMHADISGDDAREFAAQPRKGGATEEKQSFLSDEDCQAFVKAFTKGAAQ
ncbi:TPA: hypothetical protein O8L21_001642 [Enterobacter cloacae]|uniref:hypothetical protein n=1 Tax=Enterobacter cloacae complex TaxID=354276 RepID=UPI00079128C7|nr:hypothetical protein [Enterobacter hormaechei]HDC4350362.1 hypothetical protein [Enterobacter cloacae]AWV77230.1 hypothetical protein DN066_18210 [Enterobacter hormaechei subsp. xiangfangensis]MBM7218138.1 hypothetical protein [Enterobacter hormaechei]MBM7305214.1 hypothetical protein [Enterobacter hormaechei]MBN4031532.1 hypothetical protein [Enterobacter hormaechei]